MGMYTEIVIKACIKSNIDKVDRDILNFMFNRDVDPPDVLPEHEFFKCDRWDSIGCMSSFYHIPWASSKYSQDYLFSRSDLKDYGGEIDLFFDYLRPLVNGYRGEESPVYADPLCIGYKWYEEYSSPTLVYL